MNSCLLNFKQEIKKEKNIKNAKIRNFPFNLITGSSDLKERRANMKPVIKKVPNTARK